MSALNEDCLGLVFEQLLDEPFASLDPTLSLQHCLDVRKALHSCILTCKSWSSVARIPLCRRIIIRYDDKDFDWWIQNIDANNIYEGQIKEWVREVVIVGRRYGRRIHHSFSSFRSAQRIDLSILTRTFPHFHRLIVHSTSGLAFIEESTTKQITDVVFCDDASDGFLVLFTLPTFQSLQRLEIGGNGYYDDRLDYSTRHSHAEDEGPGNSDTDRGSLKTLTLRESRLGVKALRFLLQSCKSDERLSLRLHGKLWSSGQLPLPNLTVTTGRPERRLFSDRVKTLYLDPVASLWFLNFWGIIAPPMSHYYDASTGTQAEPTRTSILFDRVDDLYLSFEDSQYLEFLLNNEVTSELRRLRVKRIFVFIPKFNPSASSKTVISMFGHSYESRQALKAAIEKMFTQIHHIEARVQFIGKH